MRRLLLTCWLLLAVGVILTSCERDVDATANATAEWSSSDELHHILLATASYSLPATSNATSLSASLAASPPVPFIRPLLAAGDVVSATVESRRGSRFQLVEYIQPIPAARFSSVSTPSAALHPPSSSSSSLSFAPTALSPRSYAGQLPTDSSHALVSVRDSLSLRQLERLVSLPYLSLAPSLLDADDSLLQSALISTVPASVPAVASTQSAASSSSSASIDYTLHSRIGRGGYGELWKARKLSAASAAGEEDGFGGETDSSDGFYILKRLLIEKGEHVRASGLREIHYGQLLADEPHIARFVEWFEVRGELWLVFRHEGLSLADYMRRVETAAHEGAAEAGRETLTPEWQMLREDMMSEDERWSWNEQRRRDSRQSDSEAHDEHAAEHDTLDLDVLEQPIPSIAPPKSDATDSSAVSALTHTDTAAADEMSSSAAPSPTSGLPAGSLLRDLLHQLLTGVAEGHRAGVTHRDIKPQNILLKLHRHHPHHRSLQRRHDHDFLSVDEESDEEQSEQQHHDSTASRSHSHDLPSPEPAGGASSSAAASLLSSSQSSASFSFSAALSSLGHVRLCDYGSAVDAAEEVNQRLYGDGVGPSSLESTLDYAPPELLFASYTAPSASFFTPSYDSWSLGVLILELLLGSRERVFALDNRVRALIQARLGHSVREDIVEKAILFRAFIEYCIYPVGGVEQPDSAAGASACNHTRVGEALRRYDPLGVGLGDLSEADDEEREKRRGGSNEAVPLNVLLYAMVRGLLQWHPHLRLGVEDALQHAYFHGDWYRCGVCQQEFELPAQLQAHVHMHMQTCGVARTAPVHRDSTACSMRGQLTAPRVAESFDAFDACCCSNAPTVPSTRAIDPARRLSSATWLTSYHRLCLRLGASTRACRSSLAPALPVPTMTAAELPPVVDSPPVVAVSASAPTASLSAASTSSSWHGLSSAVNQPESEQALDLAREAYAAGRYYNAERLCLRSIRLYDTAAGNELLSRIYDKIPHARPGATQPSSSSSSSSSLYSSPASAFASSSSSSSSASAPSSASPASSAASAPSPSSAASASEPSSFHSPPLSLPSWLRIPTKHRAPLFILWSLVLSLALLRYLGVFPSHHPSILPPAHQQRQSKVYGGSSSTRTVNGGRAGGAGSRGELIGEVGDWLLMLTNLFPLVLMLLFASGQWQRWLQHQQQQRQHAQ